MGAHSHRAVEHQFPIGIRQTRSAVSTVLSPVLSRITPTARPQWCDDDAMKRRELRVAEILLEHWDPLFVADTDFSPESEYLFEATALLGLLDSNSELAEVRSYLASSSRELNPSIDTARIDLAAQTVWDFYWSSEEWATRQPP